MASVFLTYVQIFQDLKHSELLFPASGTLGEMLHLSCQSGTISAPLSSSLLLLAGLGSVLLVGLGDFCYVTVVRAHSGVRASAGGPLCILFSQAGSSALQA